jgi:CheY-like chemotaxis protein
VAGLDLAAFHAFDLREVRARLDALTTSGGQGEIVRRELQSRLDFVLEVGLGYLGLDRRACTLSGGEMQRLRLSAQLGSGLTGALYVLDEPTTGLHLADVARLIGVLDRLVARRDTHQLDGLHGLSRVPGRGARARVAPGPSRAARGRRAPRSARSGRCARARARISGCPGWRQPQTMAEPGSSGYLRGTAGRITELTRLVSERSGPSRGPRSAKTGPHARAISSIATFDLSLTCGQMPESGRAMANILIVDDDFTIRTMFARALKDLGEIEQASNGADALRLLGSKKYSVVLLDLHMPGIDGFTILQALSQKPGPNKDTPVYVVTADGSDQSRISALRRHAVFFLSKPVPIGTLVALVDATLKKSAARAATSPRSFGAVPTPVPTAAPSKTGVLPATGRISSNPLPPSSMLGGNPKKIG